MFIVTWLPIVSVTPSRYEVKKLEIRETEVGAISEWALSSTVKAVGPPTPYHRPDPSPSERSWCQLLGPLRRYFPYHPRPTFKISFRLHTPKHPRVPQTRFTSYWSSSLHSWCWASSIYQSGNVFVALGRRRFHLRHWYPRHDLYHSDCHEPWFTRWTSQSHRFVCPPFPFHMTCFCEASFILIVVLWVWAPLSL